MFTDKTKRAKKRLESLPCLPLVAEQVEFIYGPAAFKRETLQLIREAKTRIIVTALYWQDRKFWMKFIALNKINLNLRLKF